MRIGLLSDTHGWLDPQLALFFKECDEVWHCGDIGDVGVSDQLESSYKLRAVHGNIDGGELRRNYPEVQVLECEGVKVVMIHIGGYPGHYALGIKALLQRERPKLFVCGHSHIAKVQYDKQLECLHINPGAAGRSGFHHVRTAVRFTIKEGDIKDLELVEYEKR